jgi:hypothetical protein
VAAAVGGRSREPEPKPLFAFFAVEAGLAEAQADARRCATALRAARVGADEAYDAMVELFGDGRPKTLRVVELQTQLRKVDQRLGEVESMLSAAVGATNHLRYGSAAGPPPETAEPAGSGKPERSAWRRLADRWSWRETTIATYVVALALMAVFWWRGWLADWWPLLFVPFFLVVMASNTFERSTPYEWREEVAFWFVAGLWAITLVWFWASGTGSVAVLVAALIYVPALSALAVVSRRRRLAQDAAAED